MTPSAGRTPSRAAGATPPRRGPTPPARTQTGGVGRPGTLPGPPTPGCLRGLPLVSIASSSSAGGAVFYFRPVRDGQTTGWRHVSPHSKRPQHTTLVLSANPILSLTAGPVFFIFTLNENKCWATRPPPGPG